MSFNDKINFDGGGVQPVIENYNGGTDTPPASPDSGGRANDRPFVTTTNIRPPDTSPNSPNEPISYGDAAGILAALGSTDIQYATLIQETIELIQELQGEVDAGNLSQADAESQISNLEAQLEELTGADGAIQLLIGAIDSAAAGTFGDGSLVTFCSYTAPIIFTFFNNKHSSFF